jgi:hypothetical protein
MSFGDFNTAAAMRDAITKIAESVVDRMRPDTRVGRVISVNSEQLTAEVAFAGDEGSLNVRFGLSLMPRGADVLVRVAGRPGNYWITEILNDTGAHAVYEPLPAQVGEIDTTVNGPGGVVETVDNLQTTVDNLPAASDGNPPASSPACTVTPLGYSGVMIKWSAITNPDPVKYRVYFDSVNPPVQVLTETIDVLVATSILPNGNTLVAGTPYYAQIEAFEEVDGPAPTKGAVGIGTPVSISRAQINAQFEQDLIDQAAATSQAQADADFANEAALTAANIADGKGKVIFSATEPLAADRLPQNLWIDTSGSPAINQPKTWNGSTWVAVTDKAATDAAAAAAAAQTAANNAATAAATAQSTANGKNKVTYSTGQPGSTANAAGDIWFQKNASNIITGQWEGLGGTSWSAKTLDNAVIANLDAGKVTTGFLDAARLEADSIDVEYHLSAPVIVSDEIYSQEGYFGNVSIDQLDVGIVTAGQGLFSELRLGSGLVLNPNSGITITTPQGVSQLPTDGSAIVLQADVTANVLTVLGNLTIRGTSNEIATGAEIKMATEIKSPSAALVALAAYTTGSITNPWAADAAWLFGWHYHATSGHWMSVEYPQWGGVPSIVSYSKDAVDVPNPTYTRQGVVDLFALKSEITAVHSFCSQGNTMFTGVTTSELYNGIRESRPYIYKWTRTSATSWTYVSRVGVNHGVTALGKDGYSTEVMIGCKDSAGSEIIALQNHDQNFKLYRTHFNPTTMTQTVAATDTGLYNGPNYMEGSLLCTAADTGADRWWILSRGVTKISVFTSAWVRETTYDFEKVSGTVKGLGWDGTRFRSRATDKAYGNVFSNTAVYNYSRIKDTDLNSNYVHGVYTFKTYDAADTAPGSSAGDYASAETSPSPIASFNTGLMKPRQFISMAAGSTVPQGGPNSVSFYFGRGATAPALTTFKRATPVPGAGATGLLVDILPTSGGAPPAASWGYGGQTPARIVANAYDAWGSLIDFKGDGSVRIPSLMPVGTILEWATETLPDSTWLWADGGTFSQIDYPELYQKLGNTTTKPSRVNKWLEGTVVTSGVISPSSGYAVNSQTFRRLANNWVHFDITIERTGANVSLANTDHANQQIATITNSIWTPLYQITYPANVLRHVIIGSGGTISVTSGMADSSYANSNINTGNVISWQGTFQGDAPTAAPRVRYIIKAK